MALAAYRHLLRATRIAFQGDLQLLHASRSQARQGFDDNRSLETASAEASKAIEHAEGVAEILRQNIVQGRKGTGDGEHSYKLNIHKDTERGDNDTIKNPRSPTGKVKIGGT